jgi:hypothetical protein
MPTGYWSCGRQDNSRPGFAMLGMETPIRRPARHPARGSRRAANCLDVRTRRTGRPLGGCLACQKLWLTVDLDINQRDPGALFPAWRFLPAVSRSAVPPGRWPLRRRGDGFQNRQRARLSTGRGCRREFSRRCDHRVVQASLMNRQKPLNGKRTTSKDGWLAPARGKGRGCPRPWPVWLGSRAPADTRPARTGRGCWIYRLRPAGAAEVFCGSK